MAQLSDDCFVPGSEIMTAQAALELLAQKLVPVTQPERVATLHARGRILASDVVSACDVPPHDNSAVDGYAVYYDDLHSEKVTRLRVTGRAAAGHPLASTVKRGEAVRVFTGAMMPKGPDTVMMQEDCERENATVSILPGIKRGANCRKRGEDIKEGAVILRSGETTRAGEAGGGWSQASRGVPA